MEVFIGIPAYNEEEKIASIILQLKKITDKIIVCNDGSSDMTGEIARELGAIVIDHSKNKGYGAAIRSIFLKAKEINCDILVTFDADGQHKVDDIKTVIEPILNNKCDIVIGSRFLKKDDGVKIPNYRELGIKTITKLTNIALKEKLTDSQSGFRAYNKKVLTDIIPADYGMGVSTEILIKANMKGFKIIEVPISVLYEGKTSKHDPLSHGTTVLISTLKFISIEHPLKFYGIPGIILLGIGLFFVIWTIQYFTQYGDFHLTLAAIAVGTTIFGLVSTTTAILLYSLVNVVRERGS